MKGGAPSPCVCVEYMVIAFNGSGQWAGVWMLTIPSSPTPSETELRGKCAGGGTDQTLTVGICLPP